MKITNILWYIGMTICLAFVAYSVHTQVLNIKLGKEICSYSRYATTDYQRINGSLYCRSTPNSFQKLVKPVDKATLITTNAKDVFPKVAEKGETIH